VLLAKSKSILKKNKAYTNSSLSFNLQVTNSLKDSKKSRIQQTIIYRKDSILSEKSRGWKDRANGKLFQVVKCKQQPNSAGSVPSNNQATTQADSPNEGC
jgi:hypothetical protein